MLRFAAPRHFFSADGFFVRATFCLEDGSQASSFSPVSGFVDQSFPLAVLNVSPFHLLVECFVVASVLYDGPRVTCYIRAGQVFLPWNGLPVRI